MSVVSEVGRNMTAHGRTVLRVLMSVLEATDHHNTNHELAAGIERELVRRGYRIETAPKNEDEETDGTPREFIQYRAMGHGAQRALLDALTTADDYGTYAEMAWMSMIMLSNYGCWIVKGDGAPVRSWKEWHEL
jgi:hypothetical protein